MHKPNTRSKIIQAAKALFAKQDFEATSMAEIAKKVGIEKASLYYYFKDKESILASVLEEIIGNVANTLAAKYEHYKPSGDWERERRYFSSLLEFILDELCEGGLILNKVGSKEIKKHPSYPKICQHMESTKTLLGSYLRKQKVSNPDVAEEIISNATFSYVMKAQHEKPKISKVTYTAHLAALFIPHR